VDVPIAVVITTRDTAVPVYKQRELAEAAGGPVFEAPIEHLEIVAHAANYNPALLQALDALRQSRRIQAA
jgi:fermentation-respiration switch protein FrsA (DUF1100 family)